MVFWYCSYFAFGTIIGSFLNVCIHRLPMRLSVVSPPSHCPSCDSRIKSRDLIPILSYILLRGRCRFCGCGISMRYPAVELLNGLLFCLVFSFFGVGIHGVIACLFFSALTAIFFIDLKHKLIPDKINLFIAALGAVSLFLSPGDARDHLLGAVVISAPLFATAYLTKGFGLGDVKLFAAAGFLLGVKLIALAAFIAIVSGGFAGMALLASGRLTRKSEMPFGPFIVIGIMVSCLWGTQIIDWYLGRFYF